MYYVLVLMFMLENKMFCYNLLLTQSLIPASKIGLSAAFRADVALKYAKTGSSVNSPNGPWAVTGGERSLELDTSPTTSDTMRCGRLLIDEMTCP